MEFLKEMDLEHGLPGFLNKQQEFQWGGVLKERVKIHCSLHKCKKCNILIKIERSNMIHWYCQYKVGATVVGYCLQVDSVL